MIAASGFASALCIAINILFILLLIRVILSWAEAAGWRVPPSGPVRAGRDLVVDVTEPLLRPLRKLLPPMRMIDGAPLAAFAVIIVVQVGLKC